MAPGPPRVPIRLVLAWAAAVWMMACSGNSSLPATPTPSAGPGAGQDGAGVASVIVAGDIGWCGSPGPEATALLVDRLPGRLLLAGDTAYMHGSTEDFQRCFEPSWGRFRGRWHAVPGNHEYESAHAAPYFEYFGDAAGTDGTGYYSFRVGNWHVLMLNSNVPAGRGSPQWDFVRRELEIERRACTLAVWHHPLFTSGPNGPSPFMRDMFALLEAAGADVVANAHDHIYERFARQTADGRPSERGIRQFTVGTGGARLYHLAGLAPNSEARLLQFGVLRLSLEPASYRWEFIAAPGEITDAGGELCH
jgi:hypothetical protein